MSSRTPRSSGGRAARQVEPEDPYPHIPEPEQGHAGHLLAFLSVLAVLGFGFWAAFTTLTGGAVQPAAKGPAPTAAPTAAAAATAAAKAATAAPTAPAPAAAGTGPSAAGTPGEARVHVVASGDSLFGIAQRYKTTVEAIMAANGITDRNKLLHVGDRISIP
jgi:LysM repeat protein